MAMLKNGDIIWLADQPDSVVVDKFLDEGMQGEVYRVYYKGEPHALKYYKETVDIDAMYEIIRKNVKRGAPDENFLWPLQITVKDKVRNSFGYLMKLYDSKKYKPLVEFRFSSRTGVMFQSFDAMYTAAYRICKSFRKLHFAGYAYLDVSDRNILADPATGEVLICDCDNCIPSVSDLDPGILGTPGFMAPEVLMGKCRPNRTSDLFSLAVLLFELFYVDHPLEGAMTLSYPLTDELGAKLFGEYATFVMKPGKNPNGPVPGKTDNVIRRWNGNMYPLDLKDMFLRAFTDGLDARSRLSETEWIKMLVKMRGQTLARGRKVRFVNAYKPDSLPANTYAAQCGAIRFALASGSQIYKVQLEDGLVDMKADEEQEMDSFHEPVAVVGESAMDKRILGIRNEMKDCIWQVTMPGKKSQTLSFGDVAVLAHGMQISIHGKELRIL